MRKFSFNPWKLSFSSLFTARSTPPSSDQILNLEEQKDEEISSDKNEFSWSDLPIDVIVLVFRNLPVVDLLLGAPLCCSSWYQASKDVSVWRQTEIDLRLLPSTKHKNVRKRIVESVLAKNQAGCLRLVKFHCSAESIVLFLHLANRYPHLKELYLQVTQSENSEQMVEKVKKKLSENSFTLQEVEGMHIENIQKIHLPIVKHIRESCPKLTKLVASGVNNYLMLDVARNLRKLESITHSEIVGGPYWHYSFCKENGWRSSRITQIE